MSWQRYQTGNVMYVQIRCSLPCLPCQSQPFNQACCCPTSKPTTPLQNPSALDCRSGFITCISLKSVAALHLTATSTCTPAVGTQLLHCSRIKAVVWLVPPPEGPDNLLCCYARTYLPHAFPFAAQHVLRDKPNAWIDLECEPARR
jgi:hypothetical protein